MADISSMLEIQSNTAPEQEVAIGGEAQEDTTCQPSLVMTEGDDSVFYSEEDEVPQQILDSIWATPAKEPIWPEKLHSAPHIHISSCDSIGLMEASSEHDSIAMLKEMESKMENKVNNVSCTDTDVNGGTAANSRITNTEELSTPSVVPLRESTPVETAQIMERGRKSHINADKTVDYD